MKSQSLFWIDSSKLGDLLSEAGVQNSTTHAAGSTGKKPASRRPAVAEPSVSMFFDAESPGAQPASADSSSVGSSTAGSSNAETVEAFQPPEGGSLEDSLEALLDWLGSLGIGASFVADGEGLALVQREVADETIAACSSLTHLWDSLHSGLQLPAGNAIKVELQGGRRVCVIPAQSKRGIVNLGFEADDEVSRPKVQAILAAFQGLALSI